jgi:hypothetical protein
MLLQKQDNNLVKQNPMYKLIQLAFCCAIPNQKSCGSFISNTVTLKAGLLTKPIVKGAFLEPGEIIMLVNSFGQTNLNNALS